MNAYWIIGGTVGFLTVALVWVAHEVDTAARRRQQELDRLRQRGEASWTRTLELLEIESAERWRRVK